MVKMLASFLLLFGVLLSGYTGWTQSDKPSRKKFFKAAAICATIAFATTVLMAGIVYIF